MIPGTTPIQSDLQAMLCRLPVYVLIGSLGEAADISSSGR